MKTYAGIGSRETPKQIISVMNQIARVLYREGYTLRSGGAPGADQAFEWGVWSAANDEGNANKRAEIYLPWASFEHGTRPPIVPKLIEPGDGAREIAEVYHPRWRYLKFGAKKLIARNTHQILGPDLTNVDPVDFVICWTKGAKGGGGTGQAIRIAKGWDIPVYDLGTRDDWSFLFKLDNLGSFFV